MSINVYRLDAGYLSWNLVLKKGEPVKLNSYHTILQEFQYGNSTAETTTTSKAVSNPDISTVVTKMLAMVT